MKNTHSIIVNEGGHTLLSSEDTKNVNKFMAKHYPKAKDITKKVIKGVTYVSYTFGKTSEVLMVIPCNTDNSDDMKNVIGNIGGKCLMSNEGETITELYAVGIGYLVSSMLSGGDVLISEYFLSYKEAVRFFNNIT